VKDTIWKLKLATHGSTFVHVPLGYNVLKVACDGGGNVSLWVMVDAGEKTDLVVFDVFATGERVSNPHLAEYCGTAVQQTGLVWHVFRRMG